MSSNYAFSNEERSVSLEVTLAMTINKAQGQTLQKVKLFLPDPVFFFSGGTFDRDLYRVQSFSDIVLSISDIE